MTSRLARDVIQGLLNGNEFSLEDGSIKTALEIAIECLNNEQFERWMRHGLSGDEVRINMGMSKEEFDEYVKNKLKKEIY